MYKLTNQVQCRHITPEEAKRLLAINTFPGQRALNERKARGYSDMMRRGEMRPFDVAVMTLPDGKKHLANGQHCLNAVLINDAPFLATIAYYKCETLDDAWRLFATFDVHASRTEGHVMKAARGMFKSQALSEIALRTLQACGSALLILGDGKNPKFSGGSPSKTIKPTLVQNNEEQVLWIDLFSECRFLIKVPVVAAMIATYRANPDAAYEFWEKIKTGDNISGPLRIFRDFLIAGKLSSDTGGGHNKSRVVYAICISWWNSWMKGEERRGVKVGAMASLPVPASIKK